MKFRIANPRRKKRRFSKKAKRAFVRRMKLARRRKSKKIVILKKVKHCKINPKKTMARRKRSSSRRRRTSHRRRARRSNPLLAVGNPRRRRRSRRSNPFGRRRRSRRSNPSSMTSYLSQSVLKDVLWGAGGFAATKVTRSWASQFYPVGLSPTVEGALNVGVEVATAAVGGWAVNKYVSKSGGRAFAIGSLLYATWTLVGLVTGKPMSLSEYVAPRSMRLNGFRNNRRLSMGSYAPRSTALAAYPSALPKAF